MEINMKMKIISSLMCGMYISLGATSYVALGTSGVAGAIFFAAGILMVSSFYNMLVTRVFALYPFREEHGFKVSDIFIALIGNGIGCVAYAGALSLTRFGSDERIENLTKIVGLRLTDNYLSLFILAVICGFLVACACLTVKSFPDNKVASLGLSVIFIAVFVICVPEHIVADFFFFSYYSFKVGFEVKFLPILLIVTVGNLIGGMGTGYLEYYRRKNQ
ncbi:MAG: formate/nitrite transporter family protein [Oscillospiraceae bacterium]|jgi:formate/nitrite transporter FocA (FNT family)|nr:formate/nitrite transporter family protein [Oscillospiraceae bacterium]